MSAFFQQLFQAGVYKRSQGRITRQLTFAAIAIAAALGMWTLSLQLKTATKIVSMQYWLPGVLLLLALWVAYRIVNIPSFADFLIAVEAEMNKVSWPTRSELVRASIVVLVTIFVLAALLVTFDMIWRWLFTEVFHLF